VSLRLVIVVVLWSGFCSAQHPGTPILFHVTSVSSADAPDICAADGDCTATRITVEGYSVSGSSSTEYVLDCVEIIANKPLHYLVEL
jgi:hypothetical protein